MSNKFRIERIEKLFHELRYEIERGFMEGDIDGETLVFEWIVPISREITNGVVLCKFLTHPIHRDSIMGKPYTTIPKLTLVKK